MPAFTHAYFRDQSLETFSVHSRGAGLAQVTVDGDDSVQGPSECHSAISKRILPLRALGVFKDLPQRGLANVKIRIPFK
jgi:hypothetical protein